MSLDDRIKKQMTEVKALAEDESLPTDKTIALITALTIVSSVLELKEFVAEREATVHTEIENPDYLEGLEDAYGVVLAKLDKLVDVALNDLGGKDDE